SRGYPSRSGLGTPVEGSDRSELSDGSDRADSANREHLPFTLLESEAVQLFMQRAAAVRPDFAITAENGGAVARVCRRLDGIPLALELAAARLKLLTVGQVAERLDDRFRLLTEGSRIAPTRQQTLRAAMEWSFALLSEAERMLLRRLS